MENAIMNNVAVYAGALAPRTVQKLALDGVTCAVFPNAQAAPGVYVFEDIDGTKLPGVILPAGAGAEAARAMLEPLPDEMPDLPVYRIEGLPGTESLTFPENGMLQGPAAMDVNAANIALARWERTGDEVFLELYETAGKETAFEVFCESLDFGFRALFQPWEIKRFYIAADGKVRETDYADATACR